MNNLFNFPYSLERLPFEDDFEKGENLSFQEWIWLLQVYKHKTLVEIAERLNLSLDEIVIFQTSKQMPSNSQVKLLIMMLEG